ncbi:zinc-dependent metalloprotease [Actinospica sp.]|uniref:zinc-dependent metalloprotease n=1 Tax=Actinospica sp. TaxID=1872142 RepID=UPI0039C87BD2
MNSVENDELIDWQVAGATARGLARPGPAVSRAGADRAVADLRACAVAAEEHVRTFSGLEVPAAERPVLVVDSRGWVTANLDVMRTLSSPLVEKVRQYREGVPSGDLRSLANTLGAKVTGAEVGSVLAFFSTRVLGQYDPFGGAGGGRLLLVAPNIVRVERELGVHPPDFRLWVCLHEEAHRAQFGAVPWLRDHLLDGLAALVAELDLEPTQLIGRLREGIRNYARPEQRGHADVPAERVETEAYARTRMAPRSLLDLVRTPEQRAAMDRLTAVMTLLEGHATYVMDGVGPLVVPSVAEISREFARRRNTHRIRPDALLRKVLGLDAKMRQYRDGERFVRAVVGEVGMDGFNRIWTSPNTLPTMAEIAEPAAWVRRVPLRRG